MEFKIIINEIKYKIIGEYEDVSNMDINDLINVSILIKESIMIDSVNIGIVNYGLRIFRWKKVSDNNIIVIIVKKRR